MNCQNCGIEFNTGGISQGSLRNDDYVRIDLCQHCYVKCLQKLAELTFEQEARKK